MNNKEFISELASRAGFSIQESQRMMTTLTQLMGERFTEGDTINVNSFGLFEIKKRKERVIVNPASGKRMLVPPKLTLAFKPHSVWRDKIKGSQ
jgi:DNA-binding protein HU-beta/integration host factor subunit alpha